MPSGRCCTHGRVTAIIAKMSVAEKLSPFDQDSGELNVIIETPRGCRNKYSYDEKRGVFKLSGVLPAGAVFPFDFGFVPRTVGDDGDPLDVLVLMDEPVFSGCFVAARLLGVIEARQTEDGKTERNDRLIAVSAKAPTHCDVKTLTDLNATLLDEIEHFFVSYNAQKGKKFKPIGRFGPKRAKRLVHRGERKRKRK
jgi:inorganic pyrophosphatase